VQDEALGQQSVEQAFDRRSPAVGVAHPGRDRDLEHLVRAAGYRPPGRLFEEVE
jgi:hypothetical protein